MPDQETIKRRVEALSKGEWNLPEIEKRFAKLAAEGFAAKKLEAVSFKAEKERILDRVQRRAEEYCYLTRNCAKGSATALFEEFGVGNPEIIKGLNPFPGLAMSGGICGPVSGGLMAISLVFSGPDLTDFQDTRVYRLARKFLRRFEETFGSLLCPDIQALLLGKYFDPMAGVENLRAFNQAGAREKCPVAPGWGARLAAEIIIDGL